MQRASGNRKSPYRKQARGHRIASAQSMSFETKAFCLVAVAIRQVRVGRHLAAEPPSSACSRNSHLSRITRPSPAGEAASLSIAASASATWLSVPLANSVSTRTPVVKMPASATVPADQVVDRGAHLRYGRVAISTTSHFTRHRDVDQWSIHRLCPWRRHNSRPLPRASGRADAPQPLGDALGRCRAQSGRRPAQGHHLIVRQPVSALNLMRGRFVRRQQARRYRREVRVADCGGVGQGAARACNSRYRSRSSAHPRRPKEKGTNPAHQGGC